MHVDAELREGRRGQLDVLVDGELVWARNGSLLQKLMHVVVYALLTLLLVWALNAAGWSPVRACACGVSMAIALGALLEWVQLSVPGRFGNLLDIGLNITGAVFGLLLFIALKGGSLATPQPP